MHEEELKTKICVLFNNIKCGSYLQYIFEVRKYVTGRFKHKVTMGINNVLRQFFRRYAFLHS